MRTRVLIAAAVVLTACGTSAGAGDDDVTKGRTQAKRYSCPPASTVSRAAGVQLPAGRRVPFKDLSISCDYTSTTLHGHTLIASVTFGAGPDDLDTTVRILPHGSKRVPIGITDARAYSVTDPDGTVTLFAQSGDRLISLVSDPALAGRTAVAVVRVFL
jgi:predicted small secreted protein